MVRHRYLERGGVAGLLPTGAGQLLYGAYFRAHGADRTREAACLSAGARKPVIRQNSLRQFPCQRKVGGSGAAAAVPAIPCLTCRGRSEYRLCLENRGKKDRT